MQWQQTQQSPPLPFMWGNCPLASSAQACTLQLFQASILRASLAKFTWYLSYLSIIRVTKTHLFSHKRITITRWSATSHLKSVNACLWDTTFPFERINHARCRMNHQASHQGLQHPLKRIFQVRQSLSEYLNMITSSPLFQESTHPGVASALCSTLGTTPYFSVSLSLLVSRFQVAFHL